MTLKEIEKLTIQIGEVVSIMDTEGIKKIEYAKRKDGLTGFVVLMQNGKRYKVAIEETIA